MISCKTKGEIELIRRAGKVVGKTIEELGKYIKPGVSSEELDNIAGDYIRSQECTPAFLGLYGFPKNICISFNEEIVHGIPGNRTLRNGDIISLDVGATYKGWNADAAATFAVGKVSGEAEKLMKITREALAKGIEQARQGNYLYDISAAIHDHVENHKFHLVDENYCGHGIGRKVHEEPHVLNWRQNIRGIGLRRGMCLAIEPMVNIGGSATMVKSDKWTVVTADGSLSAHFEHSIAFTDAGPDILTLA